MKSKMILLVIVFTTSFEVLSKPSYNNQFTKVLLHNGNLSDKLVCFFSKSPVCNMVPQSSDNKGKAILEKKRFFLPMTQAQDKHVKNMIQMISSIENKPYSITFEPVQKPMQGMVIHIAFNPKVIGFEYDYFESIGAQKGIVFKFHYKNILNSIKDKTDKIVRVACNGAKPTIILDFGHGGTDSGAIGCFELKESELTENVGMQLASKLKKKAIVLS